MTIKIAGQTIAGGVSCTPPKTGTTAPTTSTVADYVGQLYINTTDNSKYICTAITSGTPNTYTWSDLSSITDVQVNSVSVLNNGVANIPVASANDLGTIKTRTEYGFKMTSSGNLSGLAKTAEQYSTMYDDCVIAKGTLEAVKDTYVRAVKAEYTDLSTATSTTLAINNVYGQTIPASGATYILPTVTAGVDNWCKIFIDTTDSASIQFTGTYEMSPNSPTSLARNHKYLVICQYDNLHSKWVIFIIDCGAVS